MTNIVAFAPAAHKFIPLPNHTAEIIQFTPPPRRMPPRLAEAMASDAFSPLAKRRIVEAVKMHPNGMDVIEVSLLIRLAEYWSTDDAQQMGA